MEKYIIQKTQKIVSALYLVTDFIKDNDTIKWEIREEGISYVSNAMLLDQNMIFEKGHHVYDAFIFSSNKIIALLKIANISSLISNMNSSIIINEIESLINFINKKDDNLSNQRQGYILSDSFFSTDSPLSVSDNNPKGQSNIAKIQAKNSNKEIVKDKKDNRVNSILSLLKKDSKLTIKDFVKVINDCSEKTIQRELIELVEKGIVKREGQRRWSTYSLP